MPFKKHILALSHTDNRVITIRSKYKLLYKLLLVLILPVSNSSGINTDIRLHD